MELRSSGFWLRVGQKNLGNGTGQSKMGRGAATPPAQQLSKRRREATISYATALYRKAETANLSGKETEIAAFRSTLQALEAPGDEAGRVRSLGRNHRLWSALVKDLALDDNALPSCLKRTLIELGLWCMQYSTAAILQKLSPEPLIAVNRNVLEGLLAKTPNLAVANSSNGPEITIAV